MNIEFGRVVPKVRRNFSEASAKTIASLGFAGSGAPSDPSPQGQPRRLRFDSFVLDIERGSCLSGSEELHLRPKSFEVLTYLAMNPGRVVSKDELLEALWPNVCVTEDSVVQCITELRSALGDQAQRIVKTVPRRGYRFEVMPTPEFKKRPRNRRHAMKRAAARTVAATVLLLVCTATALLFWRFGNDSDQSSAPPFSIVVLPFTELGADPARAYLGEAIAVDVITELSRLPGLFVIAPATARTLESTVDDPRKIGERLNVNYVLEGSVRAVGDRLRINAQLASARSGETLWAERFDGNGERQPAWQDELIGRIANSLNYRLTELENERTRRTRPESPEAFDLAIRGWALVYAAKTPDSYEAASGLFRRALDDDPHSVKALTGLGWTSAVSVLVGWADDPQAAIAEADDAVTRALAADADNVVAHHVRGFLLRIRHQPALAHDAFGVATQLSPSFAPGHAQLGATALELGRPGDAIEAVGQAMRLSPRDPSLGPWQALLGRARLQLGQYDDAVVWFARSIETGTPIVLTHAYLASALALAGRSREAEEALQVFLAQRPGTTLDDFIETDRRNGTGHAAQSRRIYEGLRIAGLPESAEKSLD
jgi:TolB-like protein/DNA-binding winged helix-turn-helix (wHTH) protein/Tfp pilus assembly protein PilF